MKINPIGHSDAISGYVSSAGTPSAKSAPTARISDSVELSEGAQKFSALLKAAKEAMAATDAEEQVKAADIIAHMEKGDYHVSSDAVAAGILGGYEARG